MFKYSCSWNFGSKPVGYGLCRQIISHDNNIIYIDRYYLGADAE